MTKERSARKLGGGDGASLGSEVQTAPVLSRAGSAARTIAKAAVELRIARRHPRRAHSFRAVAALAIWEVTELVADALL